MMRSRSLTDKVQAYREVRRVLRPDGHFVFNVWDRISSNEFADVVTQALAALFPNDPPLFLARTPHGYHDTRTIEAELRAAGFNQIKVETITHRSRAGSPQHPAIAYCQGTPLRNEIELILRQETGALIVLGYGRDIEAICTGGFHLDGADFGWLEPQLPAWVHALNLAQL